MSSLPDYMALGEEVARLGGKPSGKLMWLYADLYGGADRAAVSVRFAQLKVLRMGAVDGDGADEEAWQAWLSARLRALAKHRGADPQGMIRKERNGLQRIMAELELAARKADVWAGEQGWLKPARGAQLSELRERHARRTEARVVMLQTAASLNTRYGRDPEFKRWDRKLARRLARAYTELHWEWDRRPSRAERDLWYEDIARRVATGEERPVARGWDWVLSVNDDLETLSALSQKYVGRAQLLIESECSALRGATKLWVGAGHGEVREAEISERVRRERERQNPS